MARDLVKFGVLLMFISILLIVIGILLPSPHEISGGFAGCVVIFFIPICFGTGEISPYPLIIMSIFLFAAIVFIIYVLRPKKEENW